LELKGLLSFLIRHKAALPKRARVARLRRFRPW
jgi:hypothetical protein